MQATAASLLVAARGARLESDQLQHLADRHRLADRGEVNGSPARSPRLLQGLPPATTLFPRLGQLAVPLVEDRLFAAQQFVQRRDVTDGTVQADVREKSQTSAYAVVRREHPKVERKLGEMMNRHGGRRARYRGLGKILVQELMAGLATNVKRIVRLVCAPASQVSLES